jgi:hypothetical protein
MFQRDRFLRSLSCSTQLALAAGTATVAAGVVWYLDCRLAVAPVGFGVAPAYAR